MGIEIDLFLVRGTGDPDDQAQLETSIAALPG